jgi:hypothetical protein
VLAEKTGSPKAGIGFGAFTFGPILCVPVLHTALRHPEKFDVGMKIFVAK